MIERASNTTGESIAWMMIHLQIRKTRRCASFENINYPLTDNLKSRDASTSKKNSERNLISRNAWLTPPILQQKRGVH